MDWLFEQAKKSDSFFEYVIQGDSNYSELFFEHPSPTEQDVEEALQKDALSFCKENGGDPQWFVKDFLKRI